MAVALLVARPDGMASAWNLFIGNGRVDSGAPVSCTITLPDFVDDTLAIRVNGVWVKDDGNTFGADALEHDLFALAALVPLALAPGDLVELFAKDTLGVQTTTRTWSAVVGFDDGSSRTYEGGADVTTPVPPIYVAMGSFWLGWPDSVPAADTFRDLAASASFSVEGRLINDYSESRNTIDEFGPVVLFDGPDSTLPELDIFTGLSNDYLLFIGDEIFGVSGWTLLGVGVYRLHVVRAQFGTRRATHVAGAEVHFARRDQLVAVRHPQIRPDNEIAFKVTFGGSRYPSIDQVDAFGFNYQGDQIARTPENLRVGGYFNPPALPGGGSLEVSWDLPESVDQSGEGEFAFSTLIEVVQGGVVVASREVNLTSTTFIAADLASLSADFTVRATTLARDEWGILRSDPSTIDVIFA
jgi:hypothetical protein